MPSPLVRLREKLCRELAQAEYDALHHTTREARRYGALPPGQILREIAVHAREIRPQLAPLWGRQKAGVRVGRIVGEVFSTVRHYALDWIIDAQRSYRITLLGLRHGVGVAQLLRDVVTLQGDVDALRACEELIVGRTGLIVAAEERLRWFAEHAELALRSSRGKVEAGRAVQGGGRPARLPVRATQSR